MTMCYRTSDTVSEGPVAHRRSQREVPPGPSSEPSPRTSRSTSSGRFCGAWPPGPWPQVCRSSGRCAFPAPGSGPESPAGPHWCSGPAPASCLQGPCAWRSAGARHRHPDVGVRLFPDPGLPGCSQRTRCPGHDPDPGRLGAHRRLYLLVGRRACLRGIRRGNRRPTAAAPRWPRPSSPPRHPVSRRTGCGRHSSCLSWDSSSPRCWPDAPPESAGGPTRPRAVPSPPCGSFVCAETAAGAAPRQNHRAPSEGRRHTTKDNL